MVLAGSAAQLLCVTDPGLLLRFLHRTFTAEEPAWNDT